MRLYTKQPPFYCGIDLNARTMDVCILSQDGEVVLHRICPPVPTPCGTALRPTSWNTATIFGPSRNS